MLDISSFQTWCHPENVTTTAIKEVPQNTITHYDRVFIYVLNNNFFPVVHSCVYSNIGSLQSHYLIYITHTHDLENWNRTNAIRGWSSVENHHILILPHCRVSRITKRSNRVINVAKFRVKIKKKKKNHILFSLFVRTARESWQRRWFSHVTRNNRAGLSARLILENRCAFRGLFEFFAYI